MDRSFCDDSDTLYTDYFESSPPLDLTETRSNQRDTQRRTLVRPPLQQPSTTYHPTFYPPPYPPYIPRGSATPSTEEMLSSLLESQNKVVKMVENVSKRLGDLENVVSVLTTKASDSVGTASSSSPEEKKRIPPQLSVSLYTCCI